jgi:hypothetical protein
VALSVPPWSDTVQKRLGVYWADLAEKDTPEKRRLLIELLGLHEKLGLSLDELADQVEHRIARLDEGADIREDEYARLSEAVDGAIDADEEFQVEAEAVPRQLEGTLGSLSRVTRLREVRALRGFTRLIPYGDESDDERMAPLSAKPLDWLPAIELRGEGIFVALPRARVEQWEATAEVRQRFGRIDPGTGGEQLRPREVLLHTLAHVLMAELALECGYTYASLRERIYSSRNMAGLLVYTGAPDSEGTLGGLVRQGESARFTSVLLNALRRAEWCANDPLCADGRLTLSDESSVASCHACTLAPETSCERFNRVLDRGLLVGVAGLEGAGYFRPVL